MHRDRATADRGHWARGYAFLDQGLAQVVRDVKLGRRVLDKLVRVGAHDDKQRIIDLFSIIDRMMRLPTGLQHALWRDLEQLERKNCT